MTTLRIEVARYSGTTIQKVVDGLRIAGCMKHLEIDPDDHAFLPIEELKRALEADGFHVDLVPWPVPPPLPWWRRLGGWHRRVYYWGRRVVLRETVEEQLMQAFLGSSEVHEMSMRESTLMKALRKREP